MGDPWTSYDYDVPSADTTLPPDWGLTTAVFNESLKPEYRFMVDHGVQGTGDLVSIGIRNPGSSVTASMVENAATMGLDIHVDDFASRPRLSDEEKTRLRVFETLFSFDIEVAGSGCFPPLRRGYRRRGGAGRPSCPPAGGARGRRRG